MIGLRTCVLLPLTVIALVTGAPAQNMPIVPDLSPKSTAAGMKLPKYDVASVKPNKSGENMMRIMNKPDGFSCSNIPLKTLIGNAYGIRQDLISGGPGWADSTGFDVEAKVAESDLDAYKKLPPRQRFALLQALLAERFQLQVHRETKTLPMYELVVAKGGPKLTASAPDLAPADADSAKPADPAKSRGKMMMGPGMFKGEDLPMLALANQLSYIVEHTVVDKTGLTGNFDVDLKWKPDDAGPKGDDGTAENGVSIFTAVQEQLGLKLVSTKGPVETLVIDHAEMPSEN